MAFSVKQIKAILSENGMPLEKVDAAAEEICSRHTAVLDSIKEERDGYKKDAETLASVQKELDALKGKPDDGYKEKYETLQKEYDEYKTKAETEKVMAAKKAAYEEVCKDAGLTEKGVAKAVKYADWNSVELDETGKVKDAKALIKSLKEEWSEHVMKSETKGAETATPPENKSGSNYKSRDEIMAIKDDAARQKAIAQNHELFGY